MASPSPVKVMKHAFHTNDIKHRLRGPITREWPSSPVCARVCSNSRTHGINYSHVETRTPALQLRARGVNQLQHEQQREWFGESNLQLGERGKKQNVYYFSKTIIPKTLLLSSHTLI